MPPLLLTLIKGFLALIAYGLLPPVIALLIKDNRGLQRGVFFIMVMLLTFPAHTFSWMIDVYPEYRGHSRGFEFSCVVVLAMSLYLAAGMGRWAGFKWLPPGLKHYWLFCALGLLTVFSSFPLLKIDFALMPVWKFATAGLILAGTFAFIRSDKDTRVLLAALACSLILEGLVAVKLHYWNHMYQTRAWFEHQNAMAMWAYAYSFVLLAAALGRKNSLFQLGLYLIGFGAGGVLVVLALSRASIVIFGVGAAAIIGWSLLRGFTFRRLTIASVCAAGGLVLLSLSLGTILNRFHSSGDKTPQNDLRWILNRMSQAMLLDHPLTGVGWNQFGIANSRPYAPYSEMLEDWNRARGHRIYEHLYRENPLTESLYWLILAEMGFILYFIFLLLLIRHLLMGRRSVAYGKEHLLAYVVFGITIALALMYLHSQIERVLTQTKNLSAWMIFLGVLARLEYNRRYKLDPSTSEKALPLNTV